MEHVSVGSATMAADLIAALRAVAEVSLALLVATAPDSDVEVDEQDRGCAP
jgi:hypothetical protein